MLPWRSTAPAQAQARTVLSSVSLMQTMSAENTRKVLGSAGNTALPAGNYQLELEYPLATARARCDGPVRATVTENRSSLHKSDGDWTCWQFRVPDIASVRRAPGTVDPIRAIQYHSHVWAGAEGPHPQSNTDDLLSSLTHSPALAASASARFFVDDSQLLPLS
jgi:hypothetical protein